jgi:hypothetical protein
MHKPRKRTIAAAIVFIAAAGGAVAAYWGATGTGDGEAASVSAQAITVSASTGTADLYPGFTDGDLSFTVTNPNPYPVEFTSYTAGTITSSDPANCPSTNVTVVDGAISLSVAAGATALATTLPDVVTMISAAPDGCQNKTFTVTLTLSGSQTS